MESVLQQQGPSWKLLVCSSWWEVAATCLLVTSLLMSCCHQSRSRPGKGLHVQL